MKRTVRTATCTVLVALLVAAGCATATKLTRDEALQRHPGLAQLEQALSEAAAAGVSDLAPDGYREAQRAADASLKAGMKGDGEEAENQAGHGLDVLKKAQADAAQARGILVDVLAPRDDARKAGAADLYGAKMADLDGRLRDVARLVEQGRMEEAKANRAPLIEGYRALELEALKKAAGQAAESAIAKAAADGAEDLAPKTLGQAREELGVARSILDANRRDTELAAQHAHHAIQLADRAAHIAEQIKDFERLKYTDEDVVLWHQGELAAVTQPVGANPVFDAPDREVVAQLTAAVAATAARVADLEAEAAQLKTGYEAQLSAASAQAAQVERKDRETREKFDRVQALFTADEANVYLQRGNVLIAAQGFWFPPGQSEIDAVNFPLLNKIVRAIGEFPGSHVEVMGHTDATGDADLNRTLSKLRADKVARFLVDVGGVEPQRVMAEGYGEERPVASNDTVEGRAANRRVEVLIVNR
jgi:outer membrane protein OmpA-like peptidoglycan-associated protein